MASNHQFYLGSRRFTDKVALAALRDAIAAVDKQTAADPAAAAATLSPVTSLPDEVLSVAVGRQAWNVGPMTPELVAAQQAIADKFFELKLLPRPIRVADAQSDS